MALIPLFILLIVICLIGAITLWFFKKNKNLKTKHNLEMTVIKDAIIIHNSQMNNRDSGLNLYNFLKYNLDESLKVQSEINLF